MFKSVLRFDPWGEDFSNKEKRNTSRQDKGLGFNLPDWRDLLPRQFGKGKILLVLALCLAVWAASGFYIVHPEQQGLEIIFGKYQATTEPGLHYNLPEPLGAVVKVKVTTLNREEVGSNRKSNDVGEGVVLTGDENIVSINADVLWQISNPGDFVFNVRDASPGVTVKNGAESAIRDSIGKNTMAFILSGEGRAVVATQVKETLQSVLDRYSMGVSVVSVQLKKVDPPDKVIDAFRDVQSARSDREREINEAEAYRNDKIPRANGAAERVVQEAIAKKQERISAALGESKRFLLIHDQYKRGGALMKRNMYLETLKQALGSSEKWILSEHGGVHPYLPLPELMKRRPS